MRNKRIIFLLFILCVVLVMAVGCRKGIPVETYSSGVAMEQATLDKVKNTIMRVGSSLGWAIVPLTEGQLQGTLNVRAHSLVVTIDYSETRYSIRYKSSINLDYKDDKIHPQYRNWVLNLQRHIDAEMPTANLR